MLRLVAVELLVFLLPFAVWWGLVAMRRRAVSTVEVEAASSSEANGWPVIGLATVGALLVAGSLVAMSLMHEGSASGTYVPDRFVNGKLVPGHFE